MKKSALIAGLIGVVLLTGCGAKFDISSADLENWEGCTYSDVSDDYTSNYDYVDGVYVAEKDDIHVELWDLNSTSNASKWFEGNVEDIKEKAKSSSGSSTSASGDYTINTGDVVYRILFCGDKGIYAYGDDKDSLNDALSALNITK